MGAVKEKAPGIGKRDRQELMVFSIRHALGIGQHQLAAD
jgi:hypothetical protein